MVGRFDGKVAIVTGGGGGIGRADAAYITGGIYTVDGGAMA
jgi:NADP-dependent 3-hydroxy acid dehydrogenase YdfG